MQPRIAQTPSPLHPGEERWHPLGTVSPTSLVGARVQLHHAAQVANAAAISLLAPEADDSHTSFEWSEEWSALVARRIPAEQPFRVALRPADLSVMLVSADEPPATATVAVYPLDGRSRDEAFAWLVAQVALAGADAARLTMRRHFQIPGQVPDAAHPFSLGDGAPFGELAAYWSDADTLLGAVARVMPGAGEVRCWPHHFDIATLITRPRTRPGAPRATTGIGMSPGDQYYAEPYLYVSPYPYPDVRSLPRLELGSWHTQGWVGAVLPASAWVRASTPAEQRWRAATFVYGAEAAVRRIQQRSSVTGTAATPDEGG